MSFGLLEIGMKTSLASELAGGIACPTFIFTRPGAVLVEQAFSPMSLSFERSYQGFERPLPGGHGSVDLVRYRAVTARKRFFNPGNPNQYE